MTEDKHLLDAWYRYAARADGFIGGALRRQREAAFLFQEQQRTILGIEDARYDYLWLRLQAMPLPRMEHWTTDLTRLIAKVVNDVGVEATINEGRLGELIAAGLEAEAV